MARASNRRPLSELQRAIVHMLVADPEITYEEIGKKFNITRQAICNHLKKKAVNDYREKCNLDIYFKIRALREKAIENMREFLTDDDKKYKHKASEFFALKAVDEPSTLPEGNPDGPEFFDPGQEL